MALSFQKIVHRRRSIAHSWRKTASNLILFGYGKKADMPINSFMLVGNDEWEGFG